ncbi:MAG: hypothetical protein D6730_20165 [Bacteroidetes bacterium]|nr:MAG: hypothetical protein D6730_20165 [Bacteroidota bacterium]
MQFLLPPITLRLRPTFRIAHGARDEQHSLLVELKDGPDSGWGEAVASPYYQLSVARCIPRAPSALMPIADGR